MAIKGFLTDEEEKAVVDAISKAELATSGEIRLHLENKCKGDAIDRAKQLFNELKMFETNDRNGVLIYIALLDHKITIWGDEGIHKKVGQTFWDDELNKLISAFKEKEHAKGLIEVIHDMGNKLSELFPYQDDDINELDNSISKNDN